jgi:hypothetical protein
VKSYPRAEFETQLNGAAVKGINHLVKVYTKLLKIPAGSTTFESKYKEIKFENVTINSLPFVKKKQFHQHN